MLECLRLDNFLKEISWYRDAETVVLPLGGASSSEKDLLRIGLVWRTRNGSSINIAQNDWITTVGCLKAQGVRHTQQISRVSDLLNSHGTGWDESKLVVVFTSKNVHDIKQITIGGPDTQDYLASNFTRNRQFTVCFVYHLCMAQKWQKACRAGPSSSVHKSGLLFRDAEVPNKVKVYVWRMLKNGLVVGEQLQHRTIKEGVLCVACG